MDELTSFCRVCLNEKCSNFSLYLLVNKKYLPNIIQTICGVQIDEPEALICRECSLAIVQADEIIQKCKESNKILYERKKILKSHEVLIKNEIAFGRDEKQMHADSVRQKEVEKITDCNKQIQQQDSIEKPKDAFLKGTEIKREFQEVPDLETLEDALYIEPEMFVESILENPETNGSSNNSDVLLTNHPSNLPQYIPPTSPSMYSSTTSFTKPKKKIVRNREQYLKRKIRNVPVKEPLTLIGGAGVIRKRRPKSFHRAIPNFYFKCELCHEFESNVASYSVTHLNTVHQIERPAIFKCQLCDAKPFIKNQSLQEHITTIHKQQPKARDYLCTECGKSFIKNCHLQKHILSVHKRGEMPYKCEQQNCDKSYVELYALKMHMKQAHTDQTTPFTCELCGKGFAVVSRLRSHIKSAHSAEVYNCAQCGYKFTNKMRYETHIKRGRCKPQSYACRYCKRAYSKSVRLEEHLKVSHNVDPEYYF